MLLKQTAIQTVENISLLNDRARPENSFFFRQGIRPTRSPFHIIMAQIMLTFNFQLIFFKCKANHLLKMISFISFIWSVRSFFSTIGTIVFRCGTMFSQTFSADRLLFCISEELKLVYLLTIFNWHYFFIQKIFLRRTITL